MRMVFTNFVGTSILILGSYFQLQLQTTNFVNVRCSYYISRSMEDKHLIIIVYCKQYKLFLTVFK